MPVFLVFGKIVTYWSPRWKNRAGFLRRAALQVFGQMIFADGQAARRSMPQSGVLFVGQN